MLRQTVTAAAAAATVLAALVAPPTAAAAEPVVGTCYDYPKSTLGKVSSTATPVPCTAKHTAETYYTRALPDSFGLPSKASTAAPSFSALRASRPTRQPSRASPSAMASPSPWLAPQTRAVLFFSSRSMVRNSASFELRRKVLRRQHCC